MTNVSIEYCRMCGTESIPEERRKNTANNYACGNCGATLRYRALAHAYIAHFASGRANNLRQAIRKGVFDDTKILDFSLRGPTRNLLKKTPNFVNAYFWEDVEIGEEKNGVICQDITRMTFKDKTFDLVTTTDVMEHVDLPWDGFKEVRRILKPGGKYIFTIPIRYPFTDESITRATLNRKTGKVAHILDPIYHRSGELEDSLVFTDFGSDLFEKLKSIGLATSFVQTSTYNIDASRFGAFVAVRV